MYPTGVETEQQRKLRHLVEVTVFRGLSQREMESIDRATTMVSAAKGRIFYRPDEPSEVLFILKEGRVQLYRLTSDGKKLTIAVLGPHSLFGEMAMLGARMNDTFAEALDDCQICVMSHADLERVILADPRVALRMLNNIGNRLSEAETRLEDMAFKSVPARMASLLLRLSEGSGSPAEEVKGYTHLDLAESIGTYRETATQVLNQLKAAGLIEIKRKRIAILDREGLEQVSFGPI
jgi:CRP/FNR family cyclic AMP-dependent transcriptional regulator